jgi:hypothetical protein
MLLLLLAFAAEPPGTAVTMTERVMGVNDGGELFSSTRESTARSFELDVDADGVLDRVVPVFAADACSWTLRYALWLCRGTDWVLAGEVAGAPSLVEGLLHTHTVQVAATGPANRPAVGYGAEPPERRETRRIYRIQADKVVLVDETVSSGICHHCGVTECLGAKLADDGIRPP